MPLPLIIAKGAATKGYKGAKKGSKGKKKPLKG